MNGFTNSTETTSDVSDKQTKDEGKKSNSTTGMCFTITDFRVGEVKLDYLSEKRSLLTFRSWFDITDVCL